MILEAVFGVVFAAAMLDDFRLRSKMRARKAPVNVIGGLEICVHCRFKLVWVGSGITGFVDGSEKYGAAVLAAYRQRLALKSIEGLDDTTRN